MWGNCSIRNTDMSINSDYYLARAAECAVEAQQTRLANVRERCLRSEAAWRAMAARLASSEAKRQTSAEEKNAQVMTVRRSSDRR